MKFTFNSSIKKRAWKIFAYFNFKQNQPATYEEVIHAYGISKSGEFKILWDDLIDCGALIKDEKTKKCHVSENYEEIMKTGLIKVTFQPEEFITALDKLEAMSKDKR